MTLDEFIEALSKTPRDWRLTRRSHGKILLRRGRTSFCFCPITAVAFRLRRRRFKTTDVSAAAREIGLSEESGVRIYSAADFPLEDRLLRARLLRACGLKEAAP